MESMPYQQTTFRIPKIKLCTVSLLFSSFMLTMCCLSFFCYSSKMKSTPNSHKKYC